MIGSQWLSVAYGAAVMFLFMVFLARHLGPSSWAIFLYIQAIASLFAILQDGGFQVILFREKVAPSESSGPTADSLAAGYFSYVALVTLLGSAVILLSSTAYKTAFILAFIYLAGRCVTNMVSSLLKGEGFFTKEALWRFQAYTFLVLPAFFLIWFTPPSPEKVFVGFIIGQILLMTTGIGRKYIVRPKLTLPPWHMWKPCVAIMLISSATVMRFKSGIVLLKHLQPDLALVGYYGAACQLLDGVTVLAAPIADLLFRYLRQSWLDRNAFSRRFGKSMLGVIAAALLITAAGVLFAHMIIVLIYGKAYAASADILPVLLCALLFMLPNFVLAEGIIALNGERYYAFSASLCAVVHVGLNFVLIPKYLATGAAISTVAAEALLTILLGGWFIRWHRTGRIAQAASR